jgi:hypothetical protein
MMRSVRKYVILCLGIALTISLVLRPSFIVFGVETPLGESNMKTPSTPTTQGQPKFPPLPTVNENTDSSGNTFLATADKAAPQVKVETKERNCFSFSSLSEEEKKDCRDFVKGYIAGIRLAFGLAKAFLNDPARLGLNISPADLPNMMPRVVDSLAKGKDSEAYKFGVFLGFQRGAEIIDIFGVAGTNIKISPPTQSSTARPVQPG